MTIIFLYAIWFLFWYIYNLILLPKNISTENNPKLLSYVCIFTTLLTLLISNGPFTNMPFWISILGLMFVAAFIFNKNKNMGRLSNSIFQVAWLYSFTFIQVISYTTFALIFLAGHLPVVFVRHLNFRGKLIILSLVPIGGYVFSLLFDKIAFPYGFLVAVLIHFGFYALLRPVDKRYGFGIIN